MIEFFSALGGIVIVIIVIVGLVVFGVTFIPPLHEVLKEKWEQWLRNKFKN